MLATRLKKVTCMPTAVVDHVDGLEGALVALVLVAAFLEARDDDAFDAPHVRVRHVLDGRVASDGGGGGVERFALGHRAVARRQRRDEESVWRPSTM